MRFHIVTSIDVPHPLAIHQGGNLWAVPGDKPDGQTRRRAPNRNELPVGHKLKGKRVLRNVPAGSMDVLDHNTKGLVQVKPDGTVADE